MIKDRLQSTKTQDEILDQKANVGFFFFWRNKLNFDKFGLMNVNNIAAIKSWHIIYNTIIGIHCPYEN